MEQLPVGQRMHTLASTLFPIARSLTGEGNRKTLRILQEHIPLTVHEVPSGTKAFDWTVPNEWSISKAFIADEHGRKIVDFKDHTLHVVGYSTPIDAFLTLDELQKHLHSLPDQPTAIPYVTSYYKPYWGFCLSHKQRRRLKPGKYHVVIDSSLKKGHLTYGQCYIPGKIKKEIFFSTYICHPSMANNELSGPVLATYLAKWIRQKPRYYSYRFVFIPETIGSLVYMRRHLQRMKKTIQAGFILTCVGDERTVSYLPSREGNTLADRVILNVLTHNAIRYDAYSFLDRGSDERQYCSPGADLPFATLMRSKYGTYPEYHTSLDDLSLVTAKGLQESYDLFVQCIEALEYNKYYQAVHVGEPQLGKRGLYPTLSQKGSATSIRPMMNFLAYADGKMDLIDISNTIGVPIQTLIPIIDTLKKHRLIKAGKL